MSDNNVYSPPESELVASEVEDILASRWARLFGALIDTIIALAVTIPMMMVTGYWDRAMSGNDSFINALPILVLSLVVFLLLHGYLLAKHGQTIGKRLVGTRIVSVETNEILPLWKIFLLRILPLGVVSNIPMAGPLLSIVDVLFIFAKDKRCVHDHIAGTRVVVATKG